MTDILAAPAADRPCELYAHTEAPVPLRTQGHHRHPQYLQRRLWGEVRDQGLLWTCGLCHDAIHEILGWLLGESRQPNPMPSTRSSYYREAQRTYDWYVQALAEKGTS